MHVCTKTGKNKQKNQKTKAIVSCFTLFSYCSIYVSLSFSESTSDGKKSANKERYVHLSWQSIHLYRATIELCSARTKWLGQRTLNLEVPRSHALLDLFLGSPWFNSSAAIVNAIYTFFFLFTSLYFFWNIYTKFKISFSIDLLYLLRDETISLFRKCCNWFLESQWGCSFYTRWLQTQWISKENKKSVPPMQSGFL